MLTDTAALSWERRGDEGHGSSRDVDEDSVARQREPIKNTSRDRSSQRSIQTGRADHRVDRRATQQERIEPGSKAFRFIVRYSVHGLTVSASLLAFARTTRVEEPRALTRACVCADNDTENLAIRGVSTGRRHDEMRLAETKLAARGPPSRFGHRPSTLSLRSSYAGHASLAVSGAAAPREARSNKVMKRGLPSRSSRPEARLRPLGFGAASFSRYANEGWWVRQGSNL